MKLLDALQWETQRENPESWNKVYLNKDGKFWHAYNWSAWLMKMVVCTEEMQQARGDEKMLTAVRYHTKNNEYAIVGFPLESIGKYTIEYDTMTPVEGCDDTLIEVKLPEDMQQMDYEALKAAYDMWYEACSIKEPKQRSDRPVPTSIQMTQGGGGMFHILSQVLSYPLEKKTPTDNIEFISQLKQQVIGLL